MSNKIKLQNELPTMPGYTWSFWRSCYEGRLIPDGNKYWYGSTFSYTILKVPKPKEPAAYNLSIAIPNKVKGGYARDVQTLELPTLEACRDEIIRQLTLVRMGVK